MTLYPMYYSDNMYDATRFAQFLAACKIIGPNLNNEMLKTVMMFFGNQVWEREKITLIKRMCHKYDEEWRIILNGAMQMPICCEWIPTSVYLGLNMSAEEMATVMDAAKEAGIETIYKCVITDEGTLGAVLAESL